MSAASAAKSHSRGEMRQGHFNSSRENETSGIFFHPGDCHSQDEKITLASSVTKSDLFKLSLE